LEKTKRSKFHKTLVFLFTPSRDASIDLVKSPELFQPIVF